MYMIDRYCPDYSLPQIGFIFGKDHTTIIHGIDAVRVRLLDRNNFTVDLVHRVHKALRAVAG
jgi:chromosomal replication initiation ATPase DnaA